MFSPSRCSLWQPLAKSDCAHLKKMWLVKDLMFYLYLTSTQSHVSRTTTLDSTDLQNIVEKKQGKQEDQLCFVPQTGNCQLQFLCTFIPFLEIYNIGIMKVLKYFINFSGLTIISQEVNISQTLVLCVLYQNLILFS